MDAITGSPMSHHVHYYVIVSIVIDSLEAAILWKSIGEAQKSHMRSHMSKCMCILRFVELLSGLGKCYVSALLAAFRGASYPPPRVSPKSLLSM